MLKVANHFGMYFQRLGDREARGQMLTKGLFGFYLSNFLSLQPLLHIFIIGISISTKGRVLLHTVKFAGSLVACALFFQSDNASLAYQSDAECANQAKFQRSIAQKAAIGVISVFFTIPPMKVLEMGLKHKFTYRENWNPTLIAKSIRKRNIKDLLLWIVGGAYISGCLLFLVVFLASISSKDHWDFLEATGFKLINDFLIMPFFIAACFTLIAPLLMRRKIATTGIQYTVHGFIHSTVNEALTDKDALEQEADVGRKPSATRAAQSPASEANAEAESDSVTRSTSSSSEAGRTNVGSSLVRVVAPYGAGMTICAVLSPNRHPAGLRPERRKRVRAVGSDASSSRWLRREFTWPLAHSHQRGACLH